MMHLTISLARPLGLPDQRLARIVLATVAGVERVVITGGDRRIVVFGEGVPVAACEVPLREAGIVWETITSSLHHDDAQQLGAEVTAVERVRPLGR